jgi:serine/threonine protein kinase
MVSSTDKYFYTDISQIYEFFEVLGEGSFSKVYKAKFLPSGEIIAVKVNII